jgi:CRP/FNR family transcriptional regulator, anaerobic regulatory protein
LLGGNVQSLISIILTEVIPSEYLQILKERFLQNQYVGLQAEELSNCSQHLELVQFKKRDILSKIGEVEHYVYFLIKGTARIYYPVQQREICLDFAFEHDFVSAYESFLSRQPSEVEIQALSPIVALRISHTNLQQLYESSRAHERYGRLAAERMYLTKLHRERLLLSLSAEDKYLYLLQKHSILVQNLAVKDIASYLGIHPESLSRIRRNLRLSKKN